MASIYKYKDHYYIRYYDKTDQKSKSKATGLQATIANKSKANKMARDFQYQIENGYIQSKYATSPTLDELQAEYYEAKELKPKTKSIVNLAVNHLKTITGNKNIDCITKEDYTKLLKSFRASNKSKNTIAIYFRHLFALFNYAIKKDYIKINVIEKTAAEKKTKVIITEDDLQVILNNTSNIEQKHFLYFLILTGFRISSAIESYWENVDLEKNIFMCNNIKADNIKPFPIYPEFRKLLLEMTPKQKGKIFSYKSIHSLKFFSRQVDKLFESGRIKNKYTFHCFRKTAISKWMNAGLDPYDVMNLAMHSDIKVTLEFYTEIEMKRLNKTMEEKLNKNC